MRLILASTSPTRRALLEAVGLTFETMRPSVDEDRAREGLLSDGAPLSRFAHDLAVAKARDVSRRPDVMRTAHLVIGADQVLVVGERILTKPGSRAGVVETLRTLRGRTHRLYSSVALAGIAEVVWAETEVAELMMRDLTDAEIERYADRAGEAIHGCVGAYQIEGLGMTLFDRIVGDHTTILGLPMLPLLAELRRHEVTTP